jgi:Holin of 3TMs, for gene-transfer release
MDWTDLGPSIGQVAPTLGGLLGGLLPIPFGSTLGSLAGSAVAAALGVEPTPAAVSAAVAATPQDVLANQLAEAEAEAKAKWAALGEMAKADATVGVAQVDATGKTMAAELVSGAWYQRTWRPVAMFVWIASWPFQLFSILYGISSHDPAVIASLGSLVYALCAWNAAPAGLAGVYAYGRSQEKIAAASNGS